MGEVSPATGAVLAERLAGLGCYEIFLGDTIGAGMPQGTRKLVDAVSISIPVRSLAVHFHDTHGRALGNILEALEMGTRTVDSSVGGLGGFPFARGAPGNVATEAVVELLHGRVIATRIDPEKLCSAGAFIRVVLRAA
jgi:hydroxymethylglutaryl-CoA lyase